VLATLLYCADATGKWKGSLDVGGETHELNFDLKPSGDTLTGAFIVEGQSSEIQDGKIQGDTVSFWPCRNTRAKPSSWSSRARC